MVVTEIMRFSTTAPPEETIKRAVKEFEGVKPLPHFVLGTDIQDMGAFQIMSEGDAAQDYVDFGKCLRKVCGEPHNVFRVALSRSALGVDGPATAKVVEFVQTYFPVSSVTTDFQKKVEEDYHQFNEIFSREVKGRVSVASGWIQEEQQHQYDNLDGDKAKCFLVITGWESKACFDQSVSTDSFKEAIPLMLSWNAPFQMVCDALLCNV